MKTKALFIAFLWLAYADHSFAKTLTLYVDPEVDLSQIVPTDGRQATIMGIIAPEDTDEVLVEQPVEPVEEEQQEVAEAKPTATVDSGEPTPEQELGALKEDNVQLRAKLREKSGNPISPTIAREIRREQRKNNLLKMRVDGKEFRKRGEPNDTYGQIVLYVGGQTTQVDNGQVTGGVAVGGKFYFLPVTWKEGDEFPEFLNAEVDIKLVFGNSSANKVPIAFDLKGQVGGFFHTRRKGWGAYIRPNIGASASVNSYEQLTFRQKGGTRFKFGLEPQIDGGLAYESSNGKTLMLLGPSVAGFAGPYHLNVGPGGKLHFRHKRFSMQFASHFRFNRSGESVWVEDRDEVAISANAFYENRDKSDLNAVYYGPFRARTIDVEGGLYWRPGRFFWIGAEGIFRKITRKDTNVVNDSRWDAPNQSFTVMLKTGVPF